MTKRQTTGATPSTGSPAGVVNTTPVLSARGVSKTFGARRVLTDFSLDLEPGEIHGLIGQNGSGKSTLIKVLTGYHRPDPGADIVICGERHHGQVPVHGAIRVVHQDLALNPSASVAENLCVGDFPTRGARGLVDWPAAARRTSRALEPFNPRIRPDEPLENLDPTDRAFVAIARAGGGLIKRQSGLLILDEPTAYLPIDGVQKLFARLRQIAAAGVAVLFVSHDLGEVLDLTHRITVLRDGVTTFSGDTAETNRDELIRHIVGRSLQKAETRTFSAPSSSAAVALQVEDLVTPMVRLADFTLHAGEIVGFTGLLGSGFSRPLYAIFGADPSTERGTVIVRDQAIDSTQASPRGLIDLGVAMIPNDRAGLSTAQDLTARENLTLLILSRYARRGLLKRRREQREVDELLRFYAVSPPTGNLAMSALSGGNQQKLVLGKWVETEPEVLLLHEPTQGVDVGARQEIYTRLRGLADRGKAIVIASANYEELPGICDRVFVFRKGEVVTELTGDFDQATITAHCFAPADSLT